jgi:dTDP-4-dehydrorhamnose 3,5-epimerase
MQIEATEFPGLYVVKPTVFEDHRGYFFESYNEQVFEKASLPTHFVQDNQSRSGYGVVRGLHYQVNPMAQAKLVRAIEGRVLDVVVDIRKDSPTFGKHFSIELSEENRLQLFIPRGFAHGFSVLTENATFSYKCDNYYSRGHEAGIRFDDPELGIDWGLPEADIILSDKDKQLPPLSSCRNNFSLNPELP